MQGIPPPPPPPKNRVPPNESDQSGTVRSSRPWLTRLTLALLMVALLAFAALIAILLSQPQLVGLSTLGDLSATDRAVGATVQSIDATRVSMNATSVAVEQTSVSNTNLERDLRATNAAVVNAANIINQTLTQQSVDIASTNTAVAAANAQQATQAAVDRSVTQTALAIISTESQLNFEATQTAIGGLFITPTAQATPANVSLYDADFSAGTETQNWGDLPTSAAWSLAQDGTLVARVDAATLRTPVTNYGNGTTIAVEIAPLQGIAATYDLLFGVVDGAGYVLRLTHDGSTITEAGIYPFTSEGLAAVEIVPGNVFGLATGLDDATLNLRVDIALSDDLVAVRLNNSEVLLVPITNPAPVGAVGVQLPAGTRLSQFVVAAP